MSRLSACCRSFLSEVRGTPETSRDPFGNVLSPGSGDVFQGNAFRAFFGNPTLVGDCLQVAGVGEDHAPVDVSSINRLLDDMVEKFLKQAGVLPRAVVVLTRRGEVRDRIGKPQPQEPAVGDVVPELLYQTPIRSDAKEV